ncbi:MAG: hypothetical protein VKK04_09485 [Synechococcales bacterium]|nr:hypothetical protein [Synechococcales bacterium]
MADSLRASKTGLTLVEQARRAKCWNRTAPVWCDRAFTSRATLNRFWAGQSIRREIFVAICMAVGVDWRRVVDANAIKARAATVSRSLHHHSRGDRILK